MNPRDIKILKRRINNATKLEEKIEIIDRNLNEETVIFLCGEIEALIIARGDKQGKSVKKLKNIYSKAISILVDTRMEHVRNLFNAINEVEVLKLLEELKRIQTAQREKLKVLVHIKSFENLEQFEKLEKENDTNISELRKLIETAEDPKVIYNQKLELNRLKEIQVDCTMIKNHVAAMKAIYKKLEAALDKVVPASLIRDIDEFTALVRLDIAKCKSLTAAIVIIEKLMQMLDQFIKEKEFHSAYLLVSPFSNFAIEALVDKDSDYKNLSNDSFNVISEANNLFDTQYGYANYVRMRKTMKPEESCTLMLPKLTRDLKQSLADNKEAMLIPQNIDKKMSGIIETISEICRQITNMKLANQAVNSKYQTSAWCNIRETIAVYLQEICIDSDFEEVGLSAQQKSEIMKGKIKDFDDLTRIKFVGAVSALSEIVELILNRKYKELLHVNKPEAEFLIEYSRTKAKVIVEEVIDRDLKLNAKPNKRVQRPVEEVDKDKESELNKVNNPLYFDDQLSKKATKFKLPKTKNSKQVESLCYHLENAKTPAQKKKELEDKKSEHLENMQLNSLKDKWLKERKKLAEELERKQIELQARKLKQEAAVIKKHKSHDTKNPVEISIFSKDAKARGGINAGEMQSSHSTFYGEHPKRTLSSTSITSDRSHRRVKSDLENSNSSFAQFLEGANQPGAPLVKSGSFKRRGSESELNSLSIYPEKPASLSKSPSPEVVSGLSKSPSPDIASGLNRLTKSPSPNIISGLGIDSGKSPVTEIVSGTPLASTRLISAKTPKENNNNNNNDTDSFDSSQISETSDNETPDTEVSAVSFFKSSQTRTRSNASADLTPPRKASDASGNQYSPTRKRSDAIVDLTSATASSESIKISYYDSSEYYTDVPQVTPFNSGIFNSNKNNSTLVVSPEKQVRDLDAHLESLRAALGTTNDPYTKEYLESEIIKNEMALKNLLEKFAPSESHFKRS